MTFEVGLPCADPVSRTKIKSVVVILCAVCFHTMSLGSVYHDIAADPWETWPKKKIVPGVAPNPETDTNRAAEVGEAAGKEPTRLSTLSLLSIRKLILIHPFSEGNGRVAGMMTTLMGCRQAFRLWISASIQCALVDPFPPPRVVPSSALTSFRCARDQVRTMKA